MGAIRRFNALQAKGAQPQVQAKGVMFVDAVVNGMTTRCLVDTGASHNFMSVQEAKRLRCRVSKEAGSMKTVNSTAKPIDGVAHGVELHIATWKGVADFSVIPMDDYDVVLGMEFMDKFSKAWKKGEATFLATVRIDTVEKEVQPVPRAVEAVLKEFADVMPKELPNTLPPRREWTPQCQHAFDELKKALMEEPVPRLPDLSKPFEVHSDASDFAIGGVLMQDGHPLAFESRKLNDTERRYTVQEKEMTAVVHCMRTWRHYLLGSQFFDYRLEYKQGKTNVVADALSRKAVLAAVVQPRVLSCERIREGLLHDPQAKSLLELVKDGKTRRFWLDDGVLYATGKRVYVPRWDSLRRELPKECHDSKWAGHPGTHRTLALMSEAYYWPQMREDVDSFVRTCLVCQQDKTLQKQPGGLLEPLPVPTRPWESLSMDFIVSLPKSEGCGSILVVVDRFTKYATFIPAPADCNAEETARLFLKHVVKYWGIPKSIISDRDTRFTGKLWTELFKLLGSRLNFSTSFHPRTDGRTERRSESTGSSPFELATGQQPMTPNTVVSGYTGSSPAAYKTAKEWRVTNELARAQLEKATRKMKKWADKHRRDVVFQPGDMVFVKLNPSQHKSTRRLHKALLRRYEGPFPIIRSVGRVAYRVELPPRLKIYPVFHVSNLKPYHADPEEPSRGESQRAPPLMVTSFDREVECIMAKREVRRKGVPRYFEYFVKWKGLPQSEGNWEKEESLWQYKDYIEAFERDGSTSTTRTSPD
ncbi:unnamed protein product [Prunus brigantina]